MHAAAPEGGAALQASLLGKVAAGADPVTSDALALS